MILLYKKKGRINMDISKSEKRSYISKYIKVDRERYSDSEIEKLLQIIEMKNELNGVKQEYPGIIRKCYASDGRYDQQDIKTYTFVYDQKGIRILYHVDTYYDGYKDHEDDEIYETGRAILKNFNRILRRAQW